MHSYYSDRTSKSETSSIMTETITDEVWNGIFNLKNKYSENLAKNFPQYKEFFEHKGVGGFNENSFSETLISHKINIELNDSNTKLDFIEFVFNNLKDRDPRNDSTRGGNGYPKEIFWAFENTGTEIQKEFREEINLIFQRNNLVYRLDENGQIHKVIPEGFSNLITESVDIPDTEKTKIDKAVKLFYSKDAGIDDRKIACRELVDTLEKIKKGLKKIEYLKKDESDFSNIFNNFSIRHHKAGQKEIKNPIYWDWLFYALLNTVITFYKLSEETNTDDSLNF